MTNSLSKEARPAPKLRIRDEAGTARVLRQIFFRHNLRVILLTAGTLVGTVAAWALLYGFCSWLLVFFVTITDPLRHTMPRGFNIIFAFAALFGVAYAWMDQRLMPSRRAREKLRIGDVIGDFLLAVPRMTLAIWGTLRAWQHLSWAELRQAAALLHRLTEEKRVPMSGVRLQIPDPDTAQRVLFALQMTEIVEMHRKENEFWLRLNALRPAALRPGRADPATGSMGA